MSRVPQYDLLSDWDKYLLGDICKLRSENYEPKKKGSLKYIGLKHIESGIPIITNFGFETDVKSTKHRFYSSDILYGKLRPYLDKVALSNIEGISSTDILILKAEETKVLPKYLIKLLHYNRFLRYATSTMTGTTLPRTNWKTLSKFMIFLPKIIEQKKIVAFLENVDNLIQTTQRLKEKLQVCKEGLMQRLFTEGIGHTEFKDTKLGRIPKEWKLTKLENLAEIKAGGNAPQGNEYFEDGKYPFVRVQHFNGEKLFVDKWDLINDKAIKEYNLDLFPEYAIIFPKSGATINLEKRAMLPQECYLVGHLCVVIPNVKSVDRYYLFYYLKYLKLARFAAGSTLPYLNLNYISKIIIPLASLVEQNKISKIMLDVDNDIENEQNYLNNLKNIKRGLMQVLLTGKKRLK